MQTFRLFVSSPSDVMVERRRVENVASRLNGEFAGVARFEVIRWETKNYQAFSTFQAQIPRSVDCDLVIGILKWRLGTELPPEFSEKLLNGDSFPSGTAYEILTAIEKRQKSLELPDIYVFRFSGSSPTLAIEDPNRGKIEHDWQVLKTFFQNWFLTEKGHFKAAFNPYASEDDLEKQLEQLLRNWMAEKVASGRAVRWPIAVKGSPFCGLAAFDAKHAPVFFGRDHDISRAVDLWRGAIQRQSPYLLVIGASGSGKSSLARAGLVPRLTTPGVVPEVDIWRVAVIRPGDSPQGPIAALAAALMQSEAGLSRDEEGRGAALPEIAQGDSRTPADFAAVLRHADSSAIRPILNALDSVARAEHDRGNYSRDVRCDLVLLIDQLDELFAVSVGDAERNALLDLVAAMVATGRIWVLTTLRADLYPRMLGQPALKKLKEEGATFDLAPPGPTELAEIVRSPAEAAGLIYETDAASGESLDTRLLRDAEEPDMLPLVQLALSRLFEGRQQVGGELRLPLAVYRDLGGLQGIIDEAGERAIASVSEQDRARLPRLLRQLAVPARDRTLTAGDALTVRALPLTEVAPDAAARTLLDALVAARLLTVGGNEADGAEAQVRLTHQRVLEDWARARSIVAESSDFYRVRSDIEESRRRWTNGGRRGELLLARGLPLAEAENLISKYSDELTPDLRNYVMASRKRARRVQMVGWTAAAVFGLLAIGAGFEWRIASEQRAEAESARQQAQVERDRANQALGLATETANGLVFDLAQKFRDVIGIPAATIKDILDRARQLQDQLLTFGESSPDLRRAQGSALGVTSVTLLDIGDTAGAIAVAEQARDIFRTLLLDQPESADIKRELSVAYAHVGDVQKAQGKLPAALASYQENLTISGGLAQSDPGNAGRQRDLSAAYEKVGNVYVAQGNLPAAITSFQAALVISERLAESDPSNAGWQSDLLVSHKDVADVQLAQGNLPAAITSFQAALVISERLAESDPGDARWQLDLSVVQERFGDVEVAQGNLPAALTSYQASLAIRERLVRSDPGNTGWQSELSVSYDKIGDVQVAQGNLPAALASYQTGLAIRERLAKSDHGNAGWQRDLSVSYDKVGEVQLAQGNQQAALAAYQAGLSIVDRLVKSDPVNSDWQRDLLASYTHVGDVQAAQDLPAALTSYEASLAIAERLAKSDPSNTDWQRNLSVAYDNEGIIQEAQGNTPAALTSYQASLTIVDRLATSDPSNASWQRGLVVSYNHVGDVLVAQGDSVAALTSYQASLTIVDRLAKSDPSNAVWQHDVQYAIDKLGNRSYSFLLRKEFTIALKTVDMAISFAPGQIWLYTNRADALMFLDRTQEAQALYLKYRNEKDVQDGKPWTAIVLEDFADLRKLGLSNPLMDEIERQFKQ